MFDKKVTINKPSETKVIKLGSKKNIIVLEFDYNLSDEQFRNLKKQWHENKENITGLEVILLEGGAKINTILTMDNEIDKDEFIDKIIDKINKRMRQNLGDQYKPSE